MLRKLIRYAGPVLLSVALTACGSSGSQQQADEPEAVAYPAEALARYEKALNDMRSGDDLAAESALVAFSERYPDYAGPLVNLGIIHVRNGRPDEAREVLTQAIAVCENCAYAYNELGILQRRAGEFAAAEASYLKAIEADAGYPLAYYNLGVLYDLYRQRDEAALEYYEHYVSLVGDPEATSQVGMWIADLKRRLGQTQRTAQAGDTP